MWCRIRFETLSQAEPTTARDMPTKPIRHASLLAKIVQRQKKSNGWADQKQNTSLVGNMIPVSYPHTRIVQITSSTNLHVCDEQGKLVTTTFSAREIQSECGTADSSEEDFECARASYVEWLVQRKIHRKLSYT